MLRTPRSRLAGALLAVSALLPSPSWAQSGDPAQSAESSPATEAEAPPDPNALTQPKLLAFVDGGYPEAAMAEKLEAQVLLVLTIGADGFVEDAQLAGPPVGYGFDELALSAARRFVFEPATRGGEPIRARIRYRYEFRFMEPEPAAPQAAAPIAPGALELTLLDADSGKTLAGAEILVSARFDASIVLRLVSDERGKVGAKNLPPGAYELSISKENFSPEVHQEEVTPDQITALTYHLTRADKDEGYGAVARVQAPPREVTRRTIEREELTRVAGTRGDALRTIELLPGVARPPFSSGLVLIRGSAPGDSQVLLNSVPVPLLYHFGGLTSFINSRALDKIDFYPGNFSARYGRQIGGIVDVGTRDPATDRYHGVLDVNLPLDSSLLVEGPLNSKTSFLVSGRRSYLGELLTNAIPAGRVNQFAAPVYDDYQLFITHRPSNRDKLRFGAYGSSDKLKVLFAQAPDSDPSLRGIELGLKFNRQQAGWEHRYNNKLDHNIVISTGQIHQDFRGGPGLLFRLDDDNTYLRGEWRYNVSDRVQLISGTDTAIDRAHVRFIGPPPAGDGNTSGASLSSRPTVLVKDAVTFVYPALFSEVSLRPLEQWRVIPSVRLDYFSSINRFSFDPRFATLYQLTKTWRLKGGVGVFSQPPTPPQVSRTLGNPQLKPIKALHYSVGVDHNFTDDLSLGVEGFYKNIYDRVVGTDYQAAAARGDYNPPPFENDGIGRIYGLEVAGRKQASGRWFGFLSYTLMRSLRKDHNGPWYLFDYDQTHIFSAASTVRLGKNWEFGGTLRIVSGNPNTPITGASFDQNTGLYTSELGKLNSARNPTFNRLDVRLEKKWYFDSWKLAWYLDVQNVYNAKNQEGISYNFNYTETATIRGLVIIPILGLRGEL